MIDPEFYIQVAQEIQDFPMHEMTLKNQHVHNKLVFDALNDALDFFRPYGVDGPPFAWKRELVHSQVTIIDIHNYDKVLEIAKEKVMGWAETFCGVFKDKSDSVIENFIVFENFPLDDFHIHQIREERLNLMIKDENFEREEKWLNYDEEEVEVGVEIGNVVYRLLLDELVGDMESIKQKRKNLWSDFNQLDAWE